jgi:hypothetical protein
LSARKRGRDFVAASFFMRVQVLGWLDGST